MSDFTPKLQAISLGLRVGNEKIFQQDKVPTCNGEMRNKIGPNRL